MLESRQSVGLYVFRMGTFFFFLFSDPFGVSRSEFLRTPSPPPSRYPVLCVVPKDSYENGDNTVYGGRRSPEGRDKRRKGTNPRRGKYG